MNWRLGIDLGTNSLGWAVIGLNDNNEASHVIDLGVRLFSDGREPKTNEPLAVGRRVARGTRRTRDRKNLRVRAFAQELAKYGLEIKSEICPYEARNLAITKEVDKDTLARALFHLSLRRGFKSNRKIDTNDKENSERKKQQAHLRRYLDENNLSLGQFLYNRHKNGLSTRFKSGQAGIVLDYKDEKSIVYSDRSMYFEEFMLIKNKQGTKILSAQIWDKLEEILFYQRPLKAQEVGLCQFEENAKRASKHLPIAQKVRILQEVNNLRYELTGQKFNLSQEQKDEIVKELEIKASLSFKAIRKLSRFKNLSKSEEIIFNMEDREKIIGNETSYKMAKILKEFGIDWHSFDIVKQNSIIQTILDFDESDTSFNNILNGINKEWGFSKELLDNILGISFPSAHAHLSCEAMQKILPLLESGLLFYEAATEIYGGHTHLRSQTGEVLDFLPYYGEVLPKATSPMRKTTINAKDYTDEEKFGRIANPTVHIALNELRKIVNALIALYGNPYSISLELARDLKLNKKEKLEMAKHNNQAKKDNERRKEELKACGISDPSSEDMLKVRLWEELAKHGSSMSRIDVYTGKTISFCQLMSDEIEIEHILPFSRTYDNTMANKSITFRDVNREKGNKTPAEYAKFKGGKLQEEIEARAENLKKSKKWRFQENAMDIYENATLGQLKKSELSEHFEKGDQASFLARQLKDTQYMSVVAAKYLIPIVGSPYRVLPVKGSMTALLRAKWKLEFAKAKGTEDERNDHRHHAIDALVIALATPSFIKRLADHNREEQEFNKNYSKLFIPTPALLVGEERKNLDNIYNNIIISFKQDHSLESCLYGETAYGFIADEHPDYKMGNAVMRRALDALKETEIEKIRDKTLREIISSRLNELEAKGIKKHEERLAVLVQHGIQIGNKIQFVRSVRIIIKNSSIQKIPSAPYKGYTTDSYAFCDIWKIPSKGGKKDKYEGSFVSYIDAKKYANNKAKLFKKFKPHPAAKHCMRLFKNDMVQYEVEGEEIIAKVFSFSTTNNKLDLRNHIEAKAKENFRTINGLMAKQNLKKIHISPDGKILQFRRNKKEG